jgi:hypothetical protein
MNPICLENRTQSTLSLSFSFSSPFSLSYFLESTKLVLLQNRTIFILQSGEAAVTQKVTLLIDTLTCLANMKSPPFVNSIALLLNEKKKGESVKNQERNLLAILYYLTDTHDRQYCGICGHIVTPSRHLVCPGGVTPSQFIVKKP